MSNDEVKTISIYGITGSVGQSAFNVIKNSSSKFVVDTIVAKENVDDLVNISKIICPKIVIIQNKSKEKRLRTLLKDKKIDIRSGKSAILEASKRKVDIFIAATTGIAGLDSIINCIPNVKILALANKESLVCMGKIIVENAKKHNCKIIPLDSEHNALFQLLEDKEKDFLKRVIITCSGGPFLGFNKEDLKYVTLEKALNHPIWSMGKKISIDSATLMNKGLELIEAAYLFELSDSEIDILIHPQSVIHGLIEYIDGTIKASIAAPDMKIPIAYAINWPIRKSTTAEYLDFVKINNLSFQELDENVFPSIKICRSVLKLGGTAPTILNASNEEAVNSFLNNKINFIQITEVVQEVLSKIELSSNEDLDYLISSDKNAREFTKNIIRNLS